MLKGIRLSDCMLIRNLLVAVSVALSTSAFASFEQCIELFPSERVPVTQEQGRDLCFDGFAVLYSPSQKKPIYTVEVLSRSLLMQAPQERTNRFYEEARLRASERALLSDYHGSGFDRGHNSEAATKRSPQAMAQSFSLANMAPQAPEFNRGVWAKDVEKAVRKYAQRSSGNVYVFTGTAGNVGTIGRGNVVIPEYFFKLVYDQSKNKAWAYWLPNSNNARMTNESIISYPELVRRTNIDFKIPAKP